MMSKQGRTEYIEEEMPSEQESNQDSASDKRGMKATVLIVLFAIILSLFISSELSLVVQKLWNISPDSIGLARWGDAFLLRIIASLSAMTAGAFIIGTFLRVKRRAQIAGVVAALPATLFWVGVLILGIVTGSDYGFTVESVKQTIVLPSILAVLLPVVGYYSSSWGYQYHDDFQRSKSILNIKWYHWLWLLPFYVTKVVPVLVFSVITLIKFDFAEGPSIAYASIFTFISNWGYYLGRVILLLVIYGLLLSVNHAYSLLTEESETTKEKWKKAAMLFGHVVLFAIVYTLLFGKYL